MTEDIMNFDGLNSLYRKQRSSQISPMMSPTTVLPRFDSPMTSSSTTRWLPAPLNENPYEKKSVDPATTTYALTRTSDQLPPSNAYPKASDQWRPSYGYPKTSDQWSPINNAYSKTNTQQSANNSFTRPMNSPMMSNNASNAKMINSSDTTLGLTNDWCSPRCKLGILGFIIGFLTVGIALAVILVLWLRQ